VSGKAVRFTHSRLWVNLANAGWHEIDKHTGLLFFWLCLILYHYSINSMLNISYSLHKFLYP
jgi:hypothetical protein